MTTTPEPAILSFQYETNLVPRRRRLRITVHPGGRTVLTRPAHLSEKQIQTFLRAHEPWVLRQIDRMKRVEPHTPLKGSVHEYRALTQQAYVRAQSLCARFAPALHVHPSRIVIRNMSSRWGSCSARGSLSFHYKLALLPDPLAEYLVVHELCHLREMNHGPRFWSAVAAIVPAYELRRTELRSWTHT